ncbi:MAG TPA: hypothetical protein DIS79_10525 [Bacteroidetes bacterium]|nr:hypothetical protein [Bacteroidota bacterium]HRK04566.1 hypothetical protein [Chlorobiota bacterium]
MRFLVFVVAALFATNAFAQNDSAATKKRPWYDDFPFTETMSTKGRKPVIGVFGSLSDWNIDGWNNADEMTPSGRITLGFERRAPSSTSASSIDKVVYDGISLSTSFSADSASFSAFRFGFINETGYTYKFGDGPEGISLLQASNGMQWTVLTHKDLPVDSAERQRILDFGQSVRFGSSTGPILDLRVSENIAFRAGYEWHQVYPRHLFWYWAGSSIIEGIADAGVTLFVNEIGASSPAARPIMHFLLRNAVGLGFKALRSKDMNWPFATASPLNIHTFTVGVNVVF